MIDDDDARFAHRSCNQADSRGTIEVELAYRREPPEEADPPPTGDPRFRGRRRRRGVARSTITDVQLSIKLAAHGDYGDREIELSRDEFFLMIGTVQRIMPRQGGVVRPRGILGGYDDDMDELDLVGEVIQAEQ